MLDWKSIRHFVVVFACFILVQFLYLKYQQQPVWDPAVTVPLYTFLLLSAALLADKRNRLQAVFLRNEALILLMTSSLLAYCFYREYASLGGINEPTIFRTWCDQFAYYKMLDLLRSGHFNSEVYFYGLGYPVLGYFVSWMYPRDPYFIVNLSCYIINYILVYTIFGRFIRNKPLAYLAATVYALVPFPRTFIVEPWTSTVTLICYSAAIVICTKDRERWFDWPLMGLLTGTIFAARYVDIVLLIPVWVYFLFKAFRAHNMKSIFAITAGGSLAICLIFAVAYTHKVYLGGYFQTPYKNHGRPIEGGSDQDLNTYAMRLGAPTVIHIYGSLVDAKSSDWNYQEYTDLKKAVFVHNLLYLFSPIGLLIIFRQSNAKMLLGSFGVGLVLFFLIYGAHPGSSPNCLWCHSAHYFKPLSPWLMLGGVVFFLEVFAEKNRDASLNLVKMCLLLLLTYGSLSLFCMICTPTKTVFKFGKNEYSATEPIRFTYELRNRFNLSVPHFAVKEFYPYAVLVGAVNGKSIEKRMKVSVDPKNASTRHVEYIPSGKEGVKQWQVKTWAQEQPLLTITD